MGTALSKRLPERLKYGAFASPAGGNRRQSAAGRPAAETGKVSSLTKRDHVEPNPATYALMGRADGLAAGLGAEQASPEHVLLSIIWDPRTTTTSVLDRLGTKREDIVDRLTDLGAPLPPIGPPPLDETRWGEPVVIPIEQLQALTAELPGLLPPGTPFGFNHDEKEHAWLNAGEAIDLPKYIALALDAWDRRRLPCPCCGYVTLDLSVPLGERRCDVCYWIQDPVQTSDWEYRGGANEVSLVEAQENFSRFGASQVKFNDRVRPPRAEEIPPWRAEQPE
jgi:hypothetical protein